VNAVVGAGGIHSKFRGLAVGGRRAGYVGQASWRVVADGFPELSEWAVMLARGRTFLTVALGQGVVYCYADVSTSDPATVANGDWRELFTDFAEPAPRLLEGARVAHFAPIEEVAPPAWTSKGPVTGPA
jgi:hypothetical protein